MTANKRSQINEAKLQWSLEQMKNRVISYVYKLIHICWLGLVKSLQQFDHFTSPFPRWPRVTADVEGSRTYRVTALSQCTTSGWGLRGIVITFG